MLEGQQRNYTRLRSQIDLVAVSKILGQQTTVVMSLFYPSSSEDDGLFAIQHDDLFAFHHRRDVEGAHALLALRYSNADSTPSTGFTTTTNSEEQLKQLLKRLKEQRKMPPPAKAKRPYRKKSAYWEQRAKGSSSNKLAELRDITSKEIN